MTATAKAASSRTRIGVLSSSSSSDQIIVNPFTAPDEVISNHIIGIHDSQAPKYDVDSLYNVVSGIVKSSTHIGNFLDPKCPIAVELVEDKVPQSSCMPPFSALKKIACQMTCKPFNKSTAHETVVGILEKLRSYTWDAKAVIALSAFALDFGETWRLSLMERTQENAIKLHIFRLGEETKPTERNLDLITMVENTFKLIEGVLILEKKISDKTLSPNDVPTLYAARRDFYTYWAILTLLTCSNHMNELDWNIKSEVDGKLNHVVMKLNNELAQIQKEEVLVKERIKRMELFVSPSGIVDLLRALIFPLDIVELEIFDTTTQKVVSNNVLKTKNLLLFISGLDNIKDEILVLKSIHEAFKKDKEKQNYEILWVPVVEETEISYQRENFEDLKSTMPWYVLQNLDTIKGKMVLEEFWQYHGKPIVVVTNPKGEVIHKNVMHMIFVWKIEAFPFTPKVVEELSLYWNWFWKEATNVYPEIKKWINEKKYIFIYGGTDIGATQGIGAQLDHIKKDPIMKKEDAVIEHFNLSTFDQTSVSNFWNNVANFMLSLVGQKLSHELEGVLKDIETLLSLKTQKTWAILSKGNKVRIKVSETLITKILKEFDEWKVNVNQGFDEAFIGYHDKITDAVHPPCVYFQLNNIRSGVPFTITCPEPSCKKKIMEVESVSYKCCHGIHSHHAA